MRIVFLFFLFFNSSFSFSIQQFNYDVDRFSKYFTSVTPFEVNQYLFEYIAKYGLNLNMNMKPYISYNYNYSYDGKDFKIRLYVDKNTYPKIKDKFRPAVNELICTDPIFYASLFAKINLNFETYNPYTKVSHYRFGYSRESSPNCIGYQSKK